MELNLLSSNKGYSMYDGKVQATEIVSIIRVYNEVESIYNYSVVCRIGGNGVTLNYIPVLFKTETGCINNSEVERIENTTEKYAFISDVIGDKRPNSIYYWTKDGIKSIPVSKVDIRITPSTKKFWRKNDETKEFGWQVVFDWKITTINLADKIYSSEDLAKADHDFEVVEADGTSHIHPSYASLAKLTDTQQAIFDNLLNAFKACQDNNIGIVLHNWEGAISAYNADCGVNLECGYDSPDDDAVAIDQVLPQGQHYISVPYICMGDDDSIWAYEKHSN